MTTLSSKALLVSLAISQWTARRYDKQETSALAQRHGTPTEVARVNKSLLPFAAPLDAIHKKTGEIRTVYYRRTLPWGQHGVNIIKSDGYMDFCSEMSPLLDDWRRLVDAFVIAYPQLREDAKLLLQGLWKEEDYPEPETVRAKFDIDVSFMPVPDQADWRVSLGDEEMERLRLQITAKVHDSQTMAMKEAWKRVYDMVQHAHGRLADPKAIFRDSLVENARELCALLPVLNIADDPEMEKVRHDIEGTLCTYNTDTLREDPKVRSDAARQLEEVMSKMSAFYAPS